MEHDVLWIVRRCELEASSGLIRNIHGIKIGWLSLSYHLSDQGILLVSQSPVLWIFQVVLVWTPPSDTMLWSLEHDSS